MIHTGQIHQAWEQGPVAIRALRSLTSEAFRVVADAAGELPGTWRVEQHDDYDGYLSVLICAEGDNNAPTYLISGQVGQIELAQIQGDELHTLGRFENMEAITAELVRALQLSVAK
jgi:hypothetical protein